MSNQNLQHQIKPTEEFAQEFPTKVQNQIKVSELEHKTSKNQSEESFQGFQY